MLGSKEMSMAYKMSRSAFSSVRMVENELLNECENTVSKSVNDSVSEEGSTVQSTREKILLSAFDEIYEHGFQGMRIENVLLETGLAKGALYHHFKNKKDLGYAVVDEIILVVFKNQLSQLSLSEDPLATYCDMVESKAQNCSERDVLYGCPLNNLAQEMSGLDVGFQHRLANIFDLWKLELAKAIKKAKKLKQVRQDVDEDIVATFIVSSMQGCVGTAKCLQSPKMFKSLMQTLNQFITSLRV